MDDQVDSTTIPRPEYPRPQFVRDEWSNLNGEWEFAFDDEDRGVEDRWFDGRELPLRIVVPFAYQAKLSGINEKTIHEIVWYARSFEVPEPWEQGSRKSIASYLRRGFDMECGGKERSDAPPLFVSGLIQRTESGGASLRSLPPHSKVVYFARSNKPHFR